MKTGLNALVALLLSTQLTHAATSVDIDVSVTTDAAACTPTLSHNGVVDFGQRLSNQLSATHYTQWGSRDITLNIMCEASTAVAISTRDSRAESVSYGQDSSGNVGPGWNTDGEGYINDPTRLFGLGKTTEGKNIGSYAIVIDTENVQAQSDGSAVAVKMVGAGSLDDSWSVSSPSALPSDMAWFYTFATKSTGTVQPITSATVPLRVSASIAGGLHSANTITLDGRATISLVYL